jgi:hypothetical protein
MSSSVRIRVRGGYVEIPFTDPKSVERIFRGVAELRKESSNIDEDRKKQ